MAALFVCALTDLTDAAGNGLLTVLSARSQAEGAIAGGSHNMRAPSRGAVQGWGSSAAQIQAFKNQQMVSDAMGPAVPWAVRALRCTPYGARMAWDLKQGVSWTESESESELFGRPALTDNLDRLIVQGGPCSTVYCTMMAYSDRFVLLCDSLAGR